MNIPNNLKYTNEHEWLKLEGNVAYIGITDFAQGELGDIVFVEFPNIGESFDRNDVFGTIEAVKTLADLFLPVSGKIVEVNEKIENEPELINSDPYNDGWLIKMTISNPDELNEILKPEDYKKIIN